MHPIRVTIVDWNSAILQAPVKVDRKQRTWSAVLAALSCGDQTTGVCKRYACRNTYLLTATMVYDIRTLL